MIWAVKAVMTNSAAPMAWAVSRSLLQVAAPLGIEVGEDPLDDDGLGSDLILITSMAPPIKHVLAARLAGRPWPHYCNEHEIWV
ncbi:hypothetical protein ACFZDJ_44040 [Streptomyces sp. NPDC007896]|uniref:hypothetical protein n=1 Tax=unclassified Streptomyces TaxID=2593676 RepID=UPI0036EBFA5A